MSLNLDTIKTVDTQPFRYLVSTIGNLPTSFTDSMSYYELLAWFLKFLEEQVIPTVNNNAAAVEELQQLYIQLHDYVENYFDNLDVQEEINNKLDEMAEAGTLQEIITTYIQSNVAWTFDTVADMKLATNLVAGSYAQTLGYHSINDGGGSLYYITNTGTANEHDIIEVGSLYANLVIKQPEISAKQFGAYGDNEHDDASALNALFTYAYLNKLDVLIPKGTYIVNSPINIYGPQDTSSSGLKIRGAGRGLTIIKAGNEIASVINIAAYTGSSNAANIFIEGLTLDGDQAATDGIHIGSNNFTNSRIENLLITKCTNAGIANTVSPVTNVYLSSFIKIRVTQCGIGIKLENGINTSLRIADCYVNACTNGYAIKGIYSTFENNCADGVTETVFKFNGYTGSILNPGAESPNANCVFHFTRTNATVVNAWTYGNMSDSSAEHIHAQTASNIIFEGGKILLNPETSNPDGTAEGKLYQLSQDCSISFKETRYSAYKIENTYNEFTCASSDDNRYGLISKRYAGIISYIGRDTNDNGGKANSESLNGDLLANAIYFGLGDSVRYGANGTDYRWKRRTVQGDILLSRNVKNIGGIGWIQGDDTFAEGASTYWTGGTYYKIPVIMSGTTADRPTVDLTPGQMYFDTTLGKPIWFKSGSTWVDGTGANV